MKLCLFHTIHDSECYHCCALTGAKWINPIYIAIADTTWLWETGPRR